MLRSFTVPGIVLPVLVLTPLRKQMLQDNCITEEHNVSFQISNQHCKLTWLIQSYSLFLRFLVLQ